MTFDSVWWYGNNLPSKKKCGPHMKSRMPQSPSVPPYCRLNCSQHSSIPLNRRLIQFPIANPFKYSHTGAFVHLGAPHNTAHALPVLRHSNLHFSNHIIQWLRLSTHPSSNMDSSSRMILGNKQEMPVPPLSPSLRMMLRSSSTTTATSTPLLQCGEMVAPLQ